MAHLLFTTGNLLSGTHTITLTNKLPLIRKYTVNRRFKFSSHLGQFFGGCIFILSAAAVCAAVTVNVHYQDPEDNIPNIVRVIFLNAIGPYVMVKIRRRDSDHIETSKYQADREVNGKEVPVLIETSLCGSGNSRTRRQQDNDWHSLARVLDRLFLFIFTTIIVVVSSVILTKRPEIIEKPWELWPNEAVFH